MSVAEFCQREGINASFFRSWRVKLRDAAVDGRESPGAESAMPMAAPFIDLGDLRSGGPRFEVRRSLRRCRRLAVPARVDISLPQQKSFYEDLGRKYTQLGLPVNNDNVYGFSPRAVSTP
jgi:transposase-like protein